VNARSSEFLAVGERLRGSIISESVVTSERPDMRLTLTVLGAASFFAALAASAPQAYAQFHNPALARVPSAAETAACRIVRERVVRPDGRVIYRSRRVCGPAIGRPHWRTGCRVVRERVVRPNGTVIYRSIRRC
jgi:hypothetical protein